MPPLEPRPACPRTPRRRTPGFRVGAFRATRALALAAVAGAGLLAAPVGAQPPDPCAGSSFEEGADLVVEKTAAPDPVAVGEEVTFTVTLTNCGPDDAIDVMLEDETTLNAVFVSAAQVSGATSFTLVTPAVGESGPVHADAVGMPAGDVAVFEIVVEVVH